jgi:hypothetical protein
VLHQSWLGASRGDGWQGSLAFVFRQAGLNIVVDPSTGATRDVPRFGDYDELALLGV